MICRFCKRDNNLTTKERGALIRRGLKQTDKTIGRPHLGKTEVVITLRARGLSIREIAAETNLSTWAVRQRIK